LLEIRDLWPESIVAVGAIKNPRVIALLEGIERFIYRKADHVVAVTNAFKKHIVKNGAREECVSVIRNGVDLSFFDSDMPRDEAYAKHIGVEGKFVAAYVGTHGMAHGLDTIIEAAELLRERDDIVFLMAGDGAERGRLQQEITQRELSNVKMLGQLPKSDMPKLWSVSDASLVLLRKLDLFLTVIPSKIFESMAMKKPIVMGVEGESREIIEAAGSGLTMEPENAQQLAQAVSKLADSKALCQQLGDSGYDYVAEHFDRYKLAAEFEQKLAQILR
jgi:glycosyltransferase involved in cell wall biosynthesis